jgi:nucleotide-binding universal stress UspA family protein
VTLRSILSPIDFSEQSRDALRIAGALAARQHSRLIVLTVVDTLLAEAAKLQLGEDRAKADTMSALREFVAATWPGGAPPGQIVLKTASGDAAATIFEAATNESVDLIVVGTQGLGGVRKLLLGSTTERILRRTPLPVLAVPSADRNTIASRPETESFELAHIVAATDFSESSLAALKTAADLARQFSAVLTLVHVAEPLAVPAQWSSVMGNSERTLTDDARARLEDLAAQVCGSQRCETIALAGRPADLIASTAAETRASLIVMGLTGNQGPLGRRPGSIAYRVLTSTTVPVLVIPVSRG